MERRKFLRNTCPTVTFAFFGLSFIQACSKSDDEGSSYSSNSNISGSAGQSSQGSSTQTNNGINQSGGTVTLDLSNSTFSNLTNPGDFINLLSIDIIILKISNTEFRAFDNCCPHNGAKDDWSYTNEQFKCGRHGNSFSIDGNEIKVGNILEIDNKLWRVLKTQHTQPGKGGAYIQAELKEIKEGTKMNSRFRSSESVERAILDEKQFQYLYKDDLNYIFMDQQTYEQIELGSDLIQNNQSKFLIENENITLQFYNEKAVGLELPDSIILKVIETEGVVKGQTAASSYKPAVLERGIKTSVPQFISVNDRVVISTFDSSYVEKAKS